MSGLDRHPSLASRQLIRFVVHHGHEFASVESLRHRDASHPVLGLDRLVLAQCARARHRLRSRHALRRRLLLRYVRLLAFVVQGVHDIPRVYVVQNYVRRRWQCLVEESLLDHLGLLLVLVIHAGVLLVVERNLVSLHEVVAEVDGQRLRILHLLLCLVRQVLVVNVLLRHVFDLTLAGSR